MNDDGAPAPQHRVCSATCSFRLEYYKDASCWSVAARASHFCRAFVIRVGSCRVWFCSQQSVCVTRSGWGDTSGPGVPIRVMHTCATRKMSRGLGVPPQPRPHHTKPHQTNKKREPQQHRNIVWREPHRIDRRHPVVAARSGGAPSVMRAEAAPGQGCVFHLQGVSTPLRRLHDAFTRASIGHLWVGANNDILWHFVRWETEPGFWICRRRALETKSRSFFWSAAMGFQYGVFVSIPLQSVHLGLYNGLQRQCLQRLFFANMLLLQKPRLHF
jgi:hypothetical protein